MSLAEVASGLDQRFELLTTGPRVAPRQRSLAAAIAWSYDLLDPPLQRALESLGVFAGPFPAHGALRVAEVSDIAALVSLVERSLVQRTPDGRFVLLESLKAFATDRLEASGRLEGVRRRHAAWVLEEVVRCDGRLAADAASAFDDVDALLAEVRAAQRFMFESGDADGSLRLVVALGDYGFFRMRPEVLVWGEEAAELGRATSHPATPAALALAGLAAWKRGRSRRAGSPQRRGDRGDRGAAAARRAPRREPRGGARAGRVGSSTTPSTGSRSRSKRPTRMPPRCSRLVTATDRALAAAYAKSPQSLHLTEALVARIPDHPTPHGAYAWHGAAEAVMDDDPAEARRRAQRRARRGRGDRGVVRHGGGGDARGLDRSRGEATSEAR